jgi:hypothetical protein
MQFYKGNVFHLSSLSHCKILTLADPIVGKI